MRAYEARAKKKIRIEEDKWIKKGEIVTVTPSKDLNKINVWMGSAIYINMDSMGFEQVKIISET